MGQPSGRVLYTMGLPEPSRARPQSAFVAPFPCNLASTACRHTVKPTAPCPGEIDETTGCGLPLRHSMYQSDLKADSGAHAGARSVVERPTLTNHCACPWFGRRRPMSPFHTTPQGPNGWSEQFNKLPSPWWSALGPGLRLSKQGCSFDFDNICRDRVINQGSVANPLLVSLWANQESNGLVTSHPALETRTLQNGGCPFAI